MSDKAIADVLSPKWIRLLELRYEDGLALDRIAMELDVGRRMLYDMHSEILTVLAYEFGLL